MQGRRKMYTDASIEVLKEISDLRNSGLSSFDIEAIPEGGVALKLPKRFGQLTEVGFVNGATITLAGTVSCRNGGHFIELQQLAGVFRPLG